MVVIVAIINFVRIINLLIIIAIVVVEIMIALITFIVVHVVINFNIMADIIAIIDYFSTRLDFFVKSNFIRIIIVIKDLINFTEITNFIIEF